MLISNIKKNLKKTVCVTTISGLFIFSKLMIASSSAQLVPLNQSTHQNAKDFVSTAIYNPTWAGGASIAMQNNATFGFKVDAQFNNDGTTGTCTLKHDHSLTQNITFPGTYIMPKHHQIISQNIPFKLVYENDVNENNYNEIYFDITTEDQPIWIACGKIENFTTSISSNTLSLDQSGNSHFWIGPKFENLKKEREIKKLVSQRRIFPQYNQN